MMKHLLFESYPTKTTNGLSSKARKLQVVKIVILIQLLHVIAFLVEYHIISYLVGQKLTSIINKYIFQLKVLKVRCNVSLNSTLEECWLTTSQSLCHWIRTFFCRKYSWLCNKCT